MLRLPSSLFARSAQSILAQLRLERRSWEDFGKLSVPEGHVIGEPVALFAKLDPTAVAALRESFSGRKGAAFAALPGVALRVGRIIGVQPHPDAKKLFVEQVDFGDEQRQIVSGLVGHYAAEELLDKRIVVVYNLRKAALRGVESAGMLLAAQDGGVVEVLELRGRWASSLQEERTRVRFRWMISPDMICALWMVLSGWMGRSCARAQGLCARNVCVRVWCVRVVLSPEKFWRAVLPLEKTI
ncbi:MAG: hypothetical protein HC945_02190 [Nitrosarchaeum sp.]|nr:hypothetical protein [Nitrosarchaeum sp.]